MYTRVRDYGDPKPKLLPVGAKHALWSRTAGLVVTPNTTRLPPEPPKDTRGEKDFSRPRLLTNSTIYKAWYPRTPHNRGEIFGRLDVTPQVLLSKVVSLPVGLGPAGDLKFTLEKELQDGWFRLEATLQRIIHFLLENHPQAQGFRELDLPVFPSALGYRGTHRTPEIVVRCAIRAQQAFTMLGALLSFVLTLWVNRDPHIAFEPAFQALLKKSNIGLSRAWLSLLGQSYVCTLSLGFRAGGIFDAYSFEWGSFLRHFIAVGVPLWFVWGHSDTVRTFMPAIHDVEMRRYYYPPEEVIRAAKERSQRGPIALPYEPPTVLHSHYELDLPQEEENYDPQTTGFVAGPVEADAPVLPRVEYGSVQPNSLQRHGEDWRDFFKRMSVERERWISKETAQDRQSREAREKIAATGLYTKNSTVFEWRLEQGFYRREILTAAEVSSHWDGYTVHQRIYTSHLKHWDLVEMLPAFPEGVHRPAEQLRPQFYDDDDDDDDDFDTSSQPPPPPANATLAEVNAALEQVDNPDLHASRDLEVLLDDGEIEAEASPTSNFEVFLELLRLRFGYDAKARYTINMSLHSITDGRFVEDAHDVVTRLGHSKFVVPPQYENSLIDFHNTLTNVTLPLSKLPVPWDLNHTFAKRVPLRRDGFSLNALMDENNDRMFVIRVEYSDPQDWVVALSKPTIVLFIFRNVHRWNTLEDIVRLLLAEGMPFAMPRRIPIKHVGRSARSQAFSRGLGGRLQGWTPNGMDYEEYQMQRKAIFQSQVGRGFRMMGGFMWRLARGQVPDDKVLLGPRNLDHIIARFPDGTVLVEDSIPQQSLEVVSGVYYVDETPRGGTVGQHSWWPKWMRWEQGGFDIGQWTPDAEIWFENRLTALKSGTLAVFPQITWKAKVKRYATKTKVIVESAEDRSMQLLREFFESQPVASQRPSKRPRH